MASRVGRDKQRYDGETGGRMVAGCVSKKKFRLSLAFFLLSIVFEILFLITFNNGISETNSSPHLFFHVVFNFLIAF